ncbi:MAG: lytic murein transglycosylase [Myxococcales bacterium]|nr:lytic murein transglycosylase [Myxococcales bacterium]MCB9641720.1 lytic murein transglycosylase [Myxococcales bacterium]
MSNKINKSNFQEQFRNKELRLSDLQQSSALTSSMKEAVKGADINHDGKISGTKEGERLFKAMDRFDRDGSQYSMTRTPAVEALLGAVQSPQAQPTQPADPAQPAPPTTTITRAAFQAALEDKQIQLSDLQGNSAIPRDVQSAVRKADLNHDGKINNDREASELFKVMDRFDRDGNAQTMTRTTVLDALLGAANPKPPPPTADPNRAVRGEFGFQPNAKTLANARKTDMGQKIPEKMEQYRETYLKASALTGVPAEIIAALHANESNFGDYRASTHGPESGFGLDDRYVSTSWGNSKLEEYGLGRWERGTGSAKSVFQSAVIAAEHLKRNAAYADISIDGQMSAGDLAGAAMSYMQGTSAAEKAHDRGTSWMFKPDDNNPHPLHPGGTSRTRGGRTVRVQPSRKEGLLRWDTLLPLIKESLR